MESNLIMSRKDLDRLQVIRSILDKHLTWQEGGSQLGLCRRQIGYLCAQVRSEGPKGIIHGLKGRPSNHQLKPGLLDQALAILEKPRYAGFGPTLAREKLEELHGIRISVAPLRQEMIQAGLWKSRKQHPKHRAWRERRPCVGELVQLDGSDHDWFEGRGPRCALVIYIDDATGRILYGEFVDVEDTLNLLRTTRAYLLVNGRPLAFYVDKDSIYKVNRQATVEEELRDIQPLTQFTRAMEELGIEVIAANSPQAKGRVERSFETHQDRLVKELRLAGISDKERANQFLWKVYFPAHNIRFAVPPANSTDAHRPLLKGHRLEETLSVRTERTLNNDFTLRLGNRFFQILREQPVRIRPKNKVWMEKRLDGSLHVRFKGSYLNFQAIDKAPCRPFCKARKAESAPKPALPSKPSRNHPWKKFSYRRRLLRKRATFYKRIRMIQRLTTTQTATATT